MPEEKKDEKKTTVSIKLLLEEATDKKGKVLKDENGEPVHSRYDSLALKMELSAIDTRQYDYKALKDFTKIQNKVDDAYDNDKLEIELSISQAAFLKTYFEEFNKKSRSDFIEFSYHLKMRMSIIEQLED